MVDNVKITGTGSDLNGAILENAATESTLRELLAAMKGSATRNTNNTGSNNLFDRITRSTNNANDSIEEFNDNIDDVNRELAKNNKTLKAYQKITQAGVASVSALDKSLRGIGNASTDATSVVQQFGSAIGGTTSRVGGAISDFGEGLSVGNRKVRGFGMLLNGLGSTLGALGSISTAAFGAMSSVIGMSQGFYDTFRQLSDTGYVLDSSFGDLIENTLDAGMTLGQFTKFIDRSRNDLVMFSGSVSAGARQVMNLRKQMTPEMIDGFLNMGVALEDIPDSLSNYMTLMGRQGRLMQQTDQEAIASAKELFKQQKLLSDLSGKSVKQLQDEAVERTRATRLQAAFNEMVPEARQAYANAAGVVETMLGPKLADGFEAIIAGDVTDPMYQAMIATAPTLTGIMENIRSQMATGQIDAEEAQAAMYNALKNGAGPIQGELNRIAEVVRYSGIETPFHTVGENLGIAMERMSKISDNSYASIMSNIEAQMAGTSGSIDGEVDPMLQGFRNIATGSQEIAIALQNVAQEITKAVGDEASNVFKTFADALGSLSNIVGDTIATLNSQLEKITSAADPDSSPGDGAANAGGGGVIERITKKITGDADIAANVDAATGIADVGLAAAAKAGGGKILGKLVPGVGAALSAEAAGAALNEGRYASMIANGVAAAADVASVSTAPAAASGVGAVVPAALKGISLLATGIDALGGYLGIPGFSSGGIVNAPKTGMLAKLHGNEAVIPLPDGKTVPVNLTGFDGIINSLSKMISQIAPTADLSGFDNVINKLPSLVSQFSPMEIFEDFNSIINTLPNIFTDTFNISSLGSIFEQSSAVNSETEFDSTMLSIQSYVSRLVDDASNVLNNNIDKVNDNSVSLDSSLSDIAAQLTGAKLIDESRLIPELVALNKNLLQENRTLNSKIDSLVKAMEQSNTISRNSSYARA